MLIKWLSDMAIAFCDFIFGLLPTWNPTMEGYHIAPFTLLVQRTDFFLPLTELFTCASLFFGIVAALFGFKVVIKVVDWVMDIIP